LLAHPVGVQADGILTDGQGEDFNPDVVMESKGIGSDFSGGRTIEGFPPPPLAEVAELAELEGAGWARVATALNEIMAKTFSVVFINFSLATN